MWDIGPREAGMTLTLGPETMYDDGSWKKYATAVIVAGNVKSGVDIDHKHYYHDVKL
jgi:hypothetical protein